jgi:DNA topoisomerase VI subunit B
MSRSAGRKVIVKESVDNALDAAEEVGILPDITIEITRRSLTVHDNGNGIPAAVIDSILDFSSRTSRRDYYVSPTRGAQGNALKTILCVPYVVSGGAGSRSAGRIQHAES